MNILISHLESNQLLLLFLVIAIGYLFGKIKIKGFSLGIAAVLFVGLAFGSLSKNLAVPDMIHTLGLVFFVYTIGIQSGPGFFSSFDRRGIAVNLSMVFVLSISAAITIWLGTTFHFQETVISGLFCGALTNTPALAAIVDTIKAESTALPAEQITQVVGEPIVGYSIAYPFGVLGAIFCLYLFRLIFKVNMVKESHEIASSLGLGSESLENQEIEITRPEMISKKVKDIFSKPEFKNLVISRILKNDEIGIADGDTVLEKGDVITLVGTPSDLEKYVSHFGEKVNLELSFDRTRLDFRRIFVSSKQVIGYSIGELKLRHKFDATITRLKRGDAEIIPTSQTVLQAGDRIRVVAKSSEMDKVTSFFGDSFQSLSEIDYISMALGISLGLLLGEVPIPLPGGSEFKLGAAGGPLLVSLILGKVGRTGNFIWGMSYNANLTLRQMGAVLFLAGIGLKAGYAFGANFQEYGIQLFFLGMLITSFSTGLMILLCRLALKIPYPMLMGIASGMQTQPAMIAYSNAEVKNSAPNYGYSIVFPLAMITKIFLVHLIYNFSQ